MKSKVGARATFALACALLAPAVAHATNECGGLTVTKIFVGSDTSPTTPGYVWVAFDTGAVALIRDSAAEFKTMYAAVLMAKSTGNKVTVRYAGQITCPGTSTDTVLGLWLE